MLTLTATHYHHSTQELFLSTNTKHFVVPSANAYDCVVCILVTMMLKYACAQASAIVFLVDATTRLKRSSLPTRF